MMQIEQARLGCQEDFAREAIRFCANNEGNTLNSVKLQAQ